MFWKKRRAEGSPSGGEDAPLRVALVFGCPRSGTSILGELIAFHPGTLYSFEARKIWEAKDIPEGDSHRLTEAQATPAAIKRIRSVFREQIEASTNPNIIAVEKSPRSTARIPFLRTVLPEAKLIHIIRDGRDTACSLVPGMGDKWDHLKPPGWQEMAAKHTGVIRCAHAWRAIVEMALADLQGVPHLELRYESLLARPVEEAKRIYAYLGLDEPAGLEEFCRKISDKTEGTYQAKGQDRWFRPDHQRRVGRWRDNLSPEEQAAVEEITAPLLKRLGYSVNEGPNE